ncbi:LysR family transcriptional regulator [Parasedimentitalea huanghaiensis]|uniref:LysR family transcriptional regulator n=1 Tax=Parasedimentitalea huanghaiensis TaxID=2682100 RepID=A0A6L6WGX6_9RHOB|nr:LysR family transcriptional regulator [Zongyanglinia huanghaiensis]MVO16189.1 LysR family transcriptional regulator [Zongyanglinia huanghaiensis]
MKVFEWDDLRFFLAILRGWSVRAAAKHLNVSHSTVSRRLQAMEDQLGIKLFIRQPDGFVLTDVGEALVERAERVESEILSMEREVFGRDARLAGLVRISTPPLLAQDLLMPILADFTERYPQIEIEVDATFDVADLRRRNADIAIRFQVQPDDGLVSHRLPDFANTIYATQDYIDGHSFTGDAPNAKWVALGGKGVQAHWRDASPYSGCKVAHVISDMQAQQSAIRSGMGFGYLNCFAADPDLALVRLTAPQSAHALPTWALTHPDLVATERVRICVRFLVEAIYTRKHQIQGTATNTF